MKGLTEKQNNFLKTVFNYTEEYGYPPSITELCEIFKVSIGTVQQYFFALERKGIIKRDNNKGRGLRFLVDVPGRDKEHVNIPIIKRNLNNSDILFSKENTVGSFKFPANILKEKEVYAVYLEDCFLIFTTNLRHKGALWVAKNKNKLILVKNKPDVKYRSVGKVIYILKKEY